MRRSIAIFKVLLLSVCLAGCVQIPREDLSLDIGGQELSGHVHFLAQPALGGRKPRTMGSRVAREYLKERFQAYGLVPWEGCKGYAQPFGLGTNMVGVLRGADEALKEEVVLICAHYDHLGRGKKGELRLGAADNASGVAALLEIAERLSLDEGRLKRSVCFAAFDCEEMGLLGAFAFTCREDYEEDRIVSVVNIDMLGRDFFDVVEDTLFVVGTEGRARLRQELEHAADGGQVRMVPLGIDVSGPSSDHVAFLSTGGPVLFFTCGHFGEYHTSRDTADRLDYGGMEREAKVICSLVSDLANADPMEDRVTLERGDTAELRALDKVLTEVSGKREQAGLSEDEGRALAELIARADALLARDEYTLKDRRDFQWDLEAFVLPILLKDKGKESDESVLLGSLISREVFRAHGAAGVKFYRQLIRHILENRPGLFRPMPEYEQTLHDVSDDEICFVEKGDKQWRLSALVPNFWTHARSGKGLAAGRVTVRFGFAYLPIDFAGTKGEVIDYCLLRWQRDAKDPSCADAWNKILETVAGQSEARDCEAWLKWRLSQEGRADEREWALGLLESTDPKMLHAAIPVASKTAPQQADQVLSKMMTRTEVRSDVRASAVRAISKSVGRDGLLVLADLLDDQTVCDKEQYTWVLDPSYPFSGHPCVRFLRKHIEELTEKRTEPPKTLASEAQEKLKSLTGKDLGADAQAWRDWIDSEGK